MSRKTVPIKCPSKTSGAWEKAEWKLVIDGRTGQVEGKKKKKRKGTREYEDIFEAANRKWRKLFLTKEMVVGVKKIVPNHYCTK